MYNFAVAYRLGKRQAAVEHTRQRIVEAARELVSSGQAASVAAVARHAGVARVTVYNAFGSRRRLLETLIPAPPAAPTPEQEAVEQLRALIRERCARWAAAPALYRHLPIPPGPSGEVERRIAERLAQADALRPGCSIKEAADVIAGLTSFGLFDGLHRDGRRSAAAVAEIVIRLAAGILADHP